MELFGLTEPIFVPDYWNPPSLFELAQRTGFDIESVIFGFAIGGIGAVLYNILARKRLTGFDQKERRGQRHRRHRWALAVPFASFPILYFLPWNPIYAAIAAMLLGAIAAVSCRPDLKFNTLLGGALFLALYSIFLLGLKCVCAGVYRPGLEPPGTQWNPDVRSALRGTAVWILVRTYVDGSLRTLHMETQCWRIAASSE